jgi:hypothetical protein
MKRFPLKVLLAILAVNSSSSFVPHSLSRAPSVGTRSIGSLQPLFSSSVDVNSLLNEDAIMSAYNEWRNKFGNGAFDPIRFRNFEINYKILTNANIKARGRALAEGRAPPQWLDLNEYGDFSREEYAAMKRGEPVRTPSQPPATDNSPEVANGTEPVRRTQSIQSPQSGGTQVIQRPTSSEPPRSTQVIPTGPASGVTETPNPLWGTQVIRKSEPPSRSTQVISRSSQVVPRDPNEPVRGTQVIQQAPEQPAVKGTQVIQQAPQQPAVRGTQVIQQAPEQPAAVRGTQVIQQAPEQPAARGTQVIQQAPEQPAARGTQVIRPSAIPSGEGPRGTIVIPRPNGQQTTQGGTRVIESPTPEWNSFGNPVVDFLDANGSGGTQVIRQARERVTDSIDGGTQVIRQASERATGAIFSLFGGPKMAEEPSPSVQGTVIVEGREKAEPTPTDGRPETVLVEKSDLQQIIPSIFSFFGLTKKAGEEADLETEAPKPVTAKPNARPSLVIDKNAVDFPSTANLPEVRRWWQNSDGSMTGYIYNSKNFNDGTKLTTSPLQRAACKPGNVVRSGGQEYLLK